LIYGLPYYCNPPLVYERQYPYAYGYSDNCD
jgi:hypothetical protein